MKYNCDWQIAEVTVFRSQENLTLLNEDNIHYTKMLFREELNLNPVTPQCQRPARQASKRRQTSPYGFASDHYQQSMDNARSRRQ